MFKSERSAKSEIITWISLIKDKFKRFFSLSSLRKSFAVSLWSQAALGKWYFLINIFLTIQMYVCVSTGLYIANVSLFLEHYLESMFSCMFKSFGGQLYPEHCCVISYCPIFYFAICHSCGLKFNTVHMM